MFGVKPSTLGFTALRTPFHRDPYHRAPPTRGDPSPQLPLHSFLRVTAVGKPPHPGSPSNPPLLGLRDTPTSRGISPIVEGSTTLINLYETRNSYEGLCSSLFSNICLSSISFRRGILSIFFLSRCCHSSPGGLFFSPSHFMLFVGVNMWSAVKSHGSRFMWRLTACVVNCCGCWCLFGDFVEFPKYCVPWL